MNQPADNWVIVFKSTSEYELTIVQAMLLENGITSEMISHQDHVFNALTQNQESALYVHKDQLDEATRIIKASEHE